MFSLEWLRPLKRDCSWGSVTHWDARGELREVHSHRLGLTGSSMFPELGGWKGEAGLCFLVYLKNNLSESRLPWAPVPVRMSLHLLT